VPASPVIKASIDFSNGVAFVGEPFILDSVTNGILGTNQLALSANAAVDITPLIASVNVRRGRQRILNEFEAGTASVTIYDQNGDFNPSNVSSPYFGDLVPLRKIQVSADYNGTEYILFTGFITKYDTGFSIGTDEVSKVTFRCVDALRLFTTAQIDTVTGSGVQLSGARVNAILDEIAYPSTLRDIDTGDSTLQADPGTSRKALDALTLVKKSELGELFLDAEGRVTFLSRSAVTTSLASPAYTFNDTGTGIAFQNAVVALDDSLVVNDVTVTRAGGTAQNVFDQDSIDKYFIHSGVRDGILVQTNTEALDMSQMLLSTRKETETRIDSIQLNLEDGDNVARVTAGLAIELMDCVEVTKAMPGSTTITQTLLVQGLDHDVNNRKFTTTVYTGESLIDGLILDSLSQGIIGVDALSY
jgi:hypothetical protein